MSLYIRRCKKCGKAYDMMSCPWCNKKKNGEEKKNPFKEIVEMIKEDFKRCGGIDEKGYYLQGINDKLYFILYGKDGEIEVQI